MQQWWRLLCECRRGCRCPIAARAVKTTVMFGLLASTPRRTTHHRRRTLTRVAFGGVELVAKEDTAADYRPLQRNGARQKAELRAHWRC